MQRIWNRWAKKTCFVLPSHSQQILCGCKVVFLFHTPKGSHYTFTLLLHLILHSFTSCNEQSLPHYKIGTVSNILNWHLDGRINYIYDNFTTLTAYQLIQVSASRQSDCPNKTIAQFYRCLIAQHCACAQASNDKVHSVGHDVR